jgi:hypothetical protein
MMDTQSERLLNQTAFRRLREDIARTYQRGQFVAISEGQIVADAETFAALRARLEAMGKDPTHVLVAQAGFDYPETAMILSQGRTS